MSMSVDAALQQLVASLCAGQHIGATIILVSLHGSVTPASPSPPPTPPPSTSDGIPSFGGGPLAFHPDRVTLCGFEVAGAEGQTLIRRILDVLRLPGPDGHPIRRTGPELAQLVDLDVTDMAIQGAIRDFRKHTVTVGSGRQRFTCQEQDIIVTGSRGRRGYGFADWITLHGQTPVKPGRRA